MENKQFTKDMIIYQCTIVRFRNGMLGIAVVDNGIVVKADDEKCFIVYSPEEKQFTTSQSLYYYDNNLRNIINSVYDHNGEPIIDIGWDVISVNKYISASEAFSAITSGKIYHWIYEINRQDY